MADPVADSTPTEPPAGTWPVNEEPTLNGHELTTTGVTDVEMKEDAPVPSESMQLDNITSSTSQPPAAPVPAISQAQLAPVNQTPAPAVSTPQSTSTAGRASSHPAQTPAPPSHPNAHGSPTRVYLNERVTPHLLEGMKYLASHEPNKPLKWLSEFLLEKSREFEGE